MFSTPSTLARASLASPAVRGVRRALTAPRVVVDPPDEPAPELLALVDDPFTSVDDVADRLSRLETLLRERGDRRSVFLTVYALMTERTDAAIREGEFADPAWMREYLVTFADYYRRAFAAFERGELDAVPRPWQLSFGTALQGETLVVQDAFLGINAHINYDLALALSDVGLAPETGAKYADHRRVDGILGRLVDAQQEVLTEVYAAGLADVDDAFGRLDERFSLFGITEGREQAWRVARVRSAADWPWVERYTEWLLRTTATGGAHYVIQPNLDRALLRKLRALEAGRAESVVGSVREAVLRAPRDTPDSES